MIFLSFASAVLWGTFRFMRNYNMYNSIDDNYAPEIFYGQLTTGIVQSISFVVLIIGILRIRGFLKHSGLNQPINSRMICLHGLCFGTFMIAEFVLLTETIIFSKSETKTEAHTRIIMWVWISCLFLQFVTQLSLIFIFLELGKKKPNKSIKTADTVTYTQENNDVSLAFDYQNENENDMVSRDTSVQDADNSLMNTKRGMKTIILHTSTVASKDGKLDESNDLFKSLSTADSSNMRKSE